MLALPDDHTSGRHRAWAALYAALDPIRKRDLESGAFDPAASLRQRIAELEAELKASAAG